MRFLFNSTISLLPLISWFLYLIDWKTGNIGIPFFITVNALVWYSISKIPAFVLRNAQLKIVKLTEIYNSLKEIEDKVSKVQDTNEIHRNIITLEGHRKLLSELRKSKPLRIISLISGYPDIGKFVQEQYVRIQKILIDHIGDISIHLTEQKELLELTKSEIAEKLKGVSELNQVSELQKVRLDRQIEQFEELQKILVKV